MHRIHAILEDQKKQHDEHHQKLKRISVLIFLICVLLIAAAVWYTQMYISELSDIVVDVSGERFENPSN